MLQEAVVVLVVDDEEMVRENLQAYLEDEGFRVITASSAEEALDLLAYETPQASIIDMRLPGMSGNDFIVQAHALYPDLAYLVHTGSTDYRLPNDVRASGVTPDDVFIKPVQNMGDLVVAILRHVKRTE